MGKAFMKKALSVLLSISAISVLTACSGGSNTAQTAASAPANETGAAETAASEEDRYGGTITVPIAADVSTLVAWELRTSSEDIVAPILYETLFKLDENGVPQPWLLESYETDTAAMTYTLKVKPGIKFHCIV